jgi:hypothetical protein
VAGERVERTLELVSLWNTGDVDRVMDEVGDEFEFTPDPSFPDSGTSSGDALRAWMHEWASTWRDNELEVLNTEARGRGVLVHSRWHLQAPESGVALPVAEFTMAVFFDDSDRTVAMAAFFDHSQAVRAIDSG